MERKILLNGVKNRRMGVCCTVTGRLYPKRLSLPAFSEKRFPANPIALGIYVKSSLYLHTLCLYLCGWAALFSISCGQLRVTGDYKSSYLGRYRESGSYRPQGRLKKNRSSKYSPQGPFHLAWPVDYIELTQRFASSSNPAHQGVDLKGKRGALVRAAHEGLVIYAGRQYRGYGKMVLLEFNEKWATLYAHLSLISVREGDVVRRGDVLGQMGDTGRASGVHLHFELIKDKQPVNPLRYLNLGQKFSDNN